MVNLMGRKKKRFERIGEKKNVSENRINIYKANGPDSLKTRITKECRYD